MGADTGYARRHLEELSTSKLDDARLLHDGGRHANAYYLAGYAVEFALKAFIARQIRAETIPLPDLGRNVYSHSFRELLRLAGLTQLVRTEMNKDPE
jgi:HEPN domain-containing protein